MTDFQHKPYLGVIPVLVKYVQKTYKGQPYFDINISGNELGLSQMALVIVNGRENQYAILAGDENDLYPYTNYASRLRIIRTNAPLFITIVNNELVFSGSEIGFENIQATIESILRTAEKNGGFPPSDHAHIEYYDDHPYLSSTSDPVVIQRI